MILLVDNQNCFGFQVVVKKKKVSLCTSENMLVSHKNVELQEYLLQKVVHHQSVNILMYQEIDKNHDSTIPELVRQEVSHTEFPLPMISNNDPSPKSDNLTTNQLSSIHVAQELSNQQFGDFTWMNDQASVSTTSYVNQLKAADVSQLAMTPPPRKFHHFPIWVQQHFTPTFQTVFTPSLSQVVREGLTLLGCFNYHEFSSVRFHTLSYYLQKLGKNNYNKYKDIVEELLII